MESVQARAVVESERAVRRSALQAVVDRAPKGMLAGKARNLLMGIARFDEMVEELGDEERMLFFLVAQVAGGGSLQEVCWEYVLDYGVVWAWLMEQPKRMDAYEEAKRGAANLYVEDVIKIADNECEEPQSRKVKIDTRFKSAAIHDKKRFGNDKGSGLTLNLGNNSLVSILSGMGRMEDVYVNDAGRAEVVEEEKPVLEVPVEFRVEPVKIEGEDLPI